jgi:hypothetical protein
MKAAAIVFFAGMLCAGEVPPPPDKPEPHEPGCTLVTVQRVFIDHLGSALGADEIRDILAATLTRHHLFIVTESEDRADAFIRGTASDTVFQEEHESNDSINAHAQASDAHSGYYGGSANKSTGLSIGETEHSRSNERKHEALAAIRLVNRDGDVLWATAQESRGAKFRGPTADVADKVAQELAIEIRRARSDAKPSKLKDTAPAAR